MPSTSHESPATPRKLNLCIHTLRAPARPDKVLPMAGTLVSYRSGDASGYAGRLFDRLRARLPKEPILKDVSHVAPGGDFVQAIDDAVASCSAVLVVIGREWMNSVSTAGYRLDNANDPVRLEIATALRRRLRVIPVLVGGATMPPEEGLPGDIRGLARRQAVELRDGMWDLDVEHLIAALESRPGVRRRTPAWLQQPGRLAGGILGILALIAISFWLSPDTSRRETTTVRLHPEVTLTAHDEIRAIAVFRDQKIASLTTRNDEELVTAWDLTSGENEMLYKERGIGDIVMVPDGRLALGFWGYIKLLNADKRKVDETIDLHDPEGEGTARFIRRLALLSDGTLLSFADSGIGICDLNAHRGRVLPVGWTEHVAVMADGRLAVLSGDVVRVLNLRSGKVEAVLEGGNEKDFALLPDGRIATSAEDGLLSLWTVDTGKQKTLRQAEAGGALYHDRLFTLPDGRLALVRSDRIEVWNTSRDQPDSVRTIATKEWTNPVLLGDGRLILAAEDGAIVLWNPKAARPDAILEGHTKPVDHLLLLEADRLASVGRDRTIRIWKLPSSRS
jgi:WD40 repeat protein